MAHANQAFYKHYRFQVPRQIKMRSYCTIKSKQSRNKQKFEKFKKEVEIAKTKETNTYSYLSS